MLDDAWDASQAAGTTLRESLRAAEKTVRGLLQNGSIQSVSKNSASQSYAFGSSATLTTADVARAWRDLINCHDGAKAAIVAAGTANPSDSSIRDEMLIRLEPAFATGLNMANLRAYA